MGRAVRIAFVTVFLIVLSVGSLGRVRAQTGARDGEWRTYGGDPGHTKYSPLDQIDRSNVNRLRIAWRWLSIDEDLKTRSDLPNTLRLPTYLNETTPLMVHGVLLTEEGMLTARPTTAPRGRARSPETVRREPDRRC